MKSVVIGEYNNLDSVSVQETPIPEATDATVVVQVKCAAMNVSDLLFAQGSYVVSAPLPAPLGFEGSGVIVKGDESLIGKRVFFASGGGAWSEYIALPKTSCFSLNDNVTFEQGASLIVNPMTVAYMIHKIKTGSHKAVMINAAASALGKMLIRWCNSIGVPTISLVRREEQVEVLRGIGATNVFNTSADGWTAQAKALCSELNPTVGFDAIGGQESGVMMDLLAYGGVVYCYGALSGSGCVINPMSLIGMRKRLEGLFLHEYLMDMTPEEKNEVGNTVQGFVNDICKTDYFQEVQLEGVRDALKTYHEKKTDNKFLVRASPN